MKKSFWLTTLLMILLVCGPSLLAQTGGLSPDRVQADIDLTDRLIDQAQELINATDNPAGIVFLEQAITTQDLAKTAFTEARYFDARRLTLLSRDLVRRALKSNRTTEQNSDLVLRKLERAGDKLDRAGELLGEIDNPTLVSIYETARENLRRAWDFYNAQQFAPAIKLAEQVEKTAERIIISVDNQSASDANYRRRLESAQEAIANAREMLADCRSAQSQNLLEQAEKGLELAQQLADAGRYPAAMQALQRAREQALRATRECRGDEALVNRYNRLFEQAEQLKEQNLTLAGENREAIDQLLVQADEQLVLAKAAIDANEIVRATAALQAAQLALRQAEAYLLKTK